MMEGKGAVVVGLLLAALVLGCVAVAGTVIELERVWYERTDHFNHPDEPAPYWTLYQPDSCCWSLLERPGTLTIRTQQGVTKNLLWQELSAVEQDLNFEIETHVVFDPIEAFHFAGLTIREDEQTFVNFGLAYCPSAIISGQSIYCVDDGLYFDLSDGVTGNPNFATKTCSPFAARLRLVRRDTTVSAYYSEDGIHWVLIGEHQLTFAPIHVGIHAGQGGTTFPDVERPASFDYFTVRFFAPPCELEQP